MNEENWYQDIKEHLLAVILYGSVAKGTNRSDSDIDILLILPLKIEGRYTNGEFFYPFEEKEINIVICSIEKLRKIAEEKSDSFQKEVFRDAKIILDIYGEVSELLTKIKLG